MSWGIQSQGFLNQVPTLAFEALVEPHTCVFKLHISCQTTVLAEHAGILCVLLSAAQVRVSDLTHPGRGETRGERPAVSSPPTFMSDSEVSLRPSRRATIGIQSHATIDSEAPECNSCWTYQP